MRTAPLIRRVILLWAISVPAATAFAQQKPDDVVRVNTELVQTDFMVTTYRFIDTTGGGK